MASIRCQYSAEAFKGFPLLELSHEIDGKRLVACLRKRGIAFHLCSSAFGSGIGPLNPGSQNRSVIKGYKCPWITKHYLSHAKQSLSHAGLVALA